MPKCRTCQTDKYTTEFPRNGAYRSGYDTRCKACKREYEAGFRFEPDPDVKWKKCSGCQIEQSTSNFYPHKKNRDGYSSICKGCHKDDYDRRAYGVTKEELGQVVGDKCMICREVGECIDHVAGTKNVRGLLCHNCNKGLGFFKHDIELLELAILYLGYGMVFVDGERNG